MNTKSTFWARSLCAAGLIGTVVLAGPYSASAQTQELDQLNNKVNRLERDLQDVQREVYSGYGRGRDTGSDSTGADPAVSARTTFRLDELDATIRNLTGQLEAINFRISQLERQYETLSGDVDYRLRALEQAAGLSPLAAGDGLGQGPGSQLGQNQASTITGPARTVNGEPATRPAPTTENVTVGSRSFNTTVRTADQPGTLGTLPVGQLPGTAAEQYEAAKSLLLAGDFAGAEVSFARFLEENKDDELAGEAQYWLGEAFYVRGAYQEAGRAFADGLSSYPDSPKAPETLLKLGMSLAALNELDQACITFNEMPNRFPNAPQPVVQRIKVEKAKAGCS